MVDVGDIADDAVDAAQEAGKDAAEAVGLEEEVDAAEDRFQGATGIDLGGSGGGRNNPDVKKQGEEDPGNTLNDSGGSSGSGNDVMPGGKDPSVNDPSDGSDPSISGNGSSGSKPNQARFETRTVEEQEKQQREKRKKERLVPNRAQRIFQEQKQRTKRNFQTLVGERAPDTQRDFGTIDDRETFQRQRFSTGEQFTPGERDIIRTAGSQAAFTQAARQGGQQLTGSELAGKAAVGGQSLFADTFFLTDQLTSEAKVVADEPEKAADVPGDVAKGFPKVVNEVVENPIEEAAPELLDLGFGAGTAVTVGQTQTVDGETVTVIGESSGETTTVGRPKIPENEKLPDTGEQALGSDPGNVLNEPSDQVLGDNLATGDFVRQPQRRTQRQQVGGPDFGEEATFQGRGSRGGVPENQQGFKREEVEVLESRRERTGANVETNIREFSDDFQGATEVEFESTVGREGDLGLKEKIKLGLEENKVVNPDSNAIGLGPGSLVPPEQDTVVEPDIDTVDSGLVDVDEGQDIGVIDTERRSNQPDFADSATGVDEAGIGAEISTSLGVNEDVGLNQGQRSGQSQGTDDISGLDETQVVEENQAQESTQTFGSTQTFVNQQEFEGVNRFVGFDQSQSNNLDNNLGFAVSSSPDFDSDVDEEFTLEEQNEISVSDDTEFAPSVAGQVFGVERRSEGEDPLFTGLEVRGVEENSSSENPGFEDSEFRF